MSRELLFLTLFFNYDQFKGEMPGEVGMKRKSNFLKLNEVR